MTDIVETNQNQVATNYNKEQVNLVKNTVAKGATDDELKMFMYLANQYNLDPFKNEIWFMKYGGKTNIMTSRDGYLKYAQMNDEFEGLISFVVKEGDVFEIDAAEYKITHKFGAKRGPILGAWARCDRKGKKPFIAYVEFSEYNKKNSIWNNYPSAMIQKVAEVFVLKRAFGINGLVTREEIDVEEVNDIGAINPLAASKEQLAEMYSLAKEKNVDGEEIKKYMRQAFEKELSTELTKEEANEVIKMLEDIEAKETIEADYEEVDDIDDIVDDPDLPWEEVDDQNMSY